MRWNAKRSADIKKKMAKDEELLRKISDSVHEILKKHGTELGNMSYIFEPKVFNIKPDELSEVMVKANKEMFKDFIVDLEKKGLLDPTWIIRKIRLGKCIPECGIIDPINLRVLEKFRLVDQLADDPVPVTMNSERLMRKIVGNKELLTELSETVFSILGEHGIKLGKNEGCVFTPCVFEKPIYAQKVSLADDYRQTRGFDPQIFADPSPQPVIVDRRPFPGIIERRGLLLPAVRVWPWWWIGIPAPEMLRALDIMRELAIP